MTEDNERRIVLALPGGGRGVIPRHEVKSTRTSKLSMMPEGIEDLLDRRELADLFAFLALDRPPGDPQARPIPGAPGALSAVRAPDVSGGPGGESGSGDRIRATPRR